MANGWGGARTNSGPKAGASKYRRLREMRKITAHEILSQHDEYKLWARFLYSKDEHVAIQALVYLTTQRDGRAYQQINPLQAQRLAAGDDPKLAAVLQNLLPQPGAVVTLTEKKVRIENVNAEGKAKLPLAPSAEPSDHPVTIDAATASTDDPSGRKVGDGHLARESHTERNQDSDVPMERGKRPGGTK